MAAETALSILRMGDRAPLKPAVVISGAHAFLREYVFDFVRGMMLRRGMKYRGFHVGGADGFDAVLAELREADLFAPVRLIACRVLRSHRGGGDQEDGADEAASGGPRSGSGAGEAAMVEAVAAMRGPGALVMVSERDGLVINCPRPYDNQLAQFADAFARAHDLRLAPGAADVLIERHAGDLA